MPNYDSPETIIEAVREWQYCVDLAAKERLEGRGYSARARYEDAVVRLVALRLPPKGEGR